MLAPATNARQPGKVAPGKPAEARRKQRCISRPRRRRFPSRAKFSQSRGRRLLRRGPRHLPQWTALLTAALLTQSPKGASCARLKPIVGAGAILSAGESTTQILCAAGARPEAQPHQQFAHQGLEQIPKLKFSQKNNEGHTDACRKKVAPCTAEASELQRSATSSLWR